MFSLFSTWFHVLHCISCLFEIYHGVWCENESIFVVLENTALNSLLYQTLSPRILLSDS